MKRFQRKKKKQNKEINVADIKSIRITNEVDPEIIGGFIIRYDGKQYNASVKQNINNLKKELTN